MNFDQMAKSLLVATKTKVAGLEDELAAAGFSRSDLLMEYRTLYDQAEETSVKRQILADIAKVQGLMTPDDNQRAVPMINITVVGDNTKVAAMLCPPAAGAA